jgi:leader peptidase (prepilin peptidase)/N-methyltransferase
VIPADVVIGGWFFLLGAVFGSFMNVVVYRGGRRESLLGFSHCPKCGAAIRWHDNIPVFGWLLLRGKCRDCRQPISFRYPVVEFVTGALFFVLAAVELLTGGANLPLFRDRDIWIFGLVVTNWAAIWMYPFHALLLAALFCWGLIRVDGFSIPKWHVAIVWLVGVIVTSNWPLVYPLKFHFRDPISLHFSPDSMLGMKLAGLGFLTGAVVALPLGLVPWEADARGDRGKQFWAIFAAFTSIGLYLGWEAVLSITAITAILRMMYAIATRFYSPLRGVPLIMDLLVATIIHLCFWDWLWDIRWWPGVTSGRFDAPWLVNVAGITAAGIVLLLANRLEKWKSSKQSS